MILTLAGSKLNRSQFHSANNGSRIRTRGWKDGRMEGWKDEAVLIPSGSETRLSSAKSENLGSFLGRGA
jgi:hypothetical protein